MSRDLKGDEIVASTSSTSRPGHAHDVESKGPVQVEEGHVRVGPRDEALAKKGGV